VWACSTVALPHSTALIYPFHRRANAPRAINNNECLLYRQYSSRMAQMRGPSILRIEMLRSKNTQCKPTPALQSPHATTHQIVVIINHWMRHLGSTKTGEQKAVLQMTGSDCDWLVWLFAFTAHGSLQGLGRAKSRGANGAANVISMLHRQDGCYSIAVDGRICLRSGLTTRAHRQAGTPSRTIVWFRRVISLHARWPVSPVRAHGRDKQSKQTWRVTQWLL
jgi:hypothetical protein